MRSLIAGLAAVASIVCSLSSPAFADGTQNGSQGRIKVDSHGAQSSGPLARSTAAHEVRQTLPAGKGEARSSGELPKMATGLRMLPFARGTGSSGASGSQATRVGFRWAGRERESNPISQNGKVVGQETRVVTRFLGRGTETVTRTTPEESSRQEYKYRQGPLGGNKAWEAHSTSTQKVGSDTVVRTSATARGGESRKEGVHASASGRSHVIKDGSVVAIGTASSGGR